MVQFYCLSVVMNIFAGLVLVYGIDLTKDKKLQKTATGEDSSVTDLEKKDGTAENKKDRSGLGNRSVRFIIGLVSIFVGMVKLFSSYGGIPVFGDLLPAAAGLLGGLSILLEFYTVTTTEEDFELKDGLKTLFIDYRKYIGVLCFVSALLHFIVPKALVL